MDESIPELSEARELLRGLAVPTGARERVLGGLRSRALERFVAEHGVFGRTLLDSTAGPGVPHEPRVCSPHAVPTVIMAHHAHRDGA